MKNTAIHTVEIKVSPRREESLHEIAAKHQMAKKQDCISTGIMHSVQVLEISTLLPICILFP